MVWLQEKQDQLLRILTFSRKGTYLGNPERYYSHPFSKENKEHLGVREIANQLIFVDNLKGEPVRHLAEEEEEENTRRWENSNSLLCTG